TSGQGRWAPSQNQPRGADHDCDHDDGAVDVAQVAVNARVRVSDRPADSSDHEAEDRYADEGERHEAPEVDPDDPGGDRHKRPGEWQGEAERDREGAAVMKSALRAVELFCVDVQPAAVPLEERAAAQ